MTALASSGAGRGVGVAPPKPPRPLPSAGGPAGGLQRFSHTCSFLVKLITQNQVAKKVRNQKSHPTSLEMTLPFSTCPHLGGFGSQTIWPPCATNAGFTIGSSHRSPPNSVAPPKTSRVFEGFERWNGDFWALFQLLEKENEILKLQFWKIHVRIQQENSHDLGIHRAYI